MTPFYLVLVIVQVALYAFGAFALAASGGGSWRSTKVAALAGAALPVATFLANLVPWWSSRHPAIIDGRRDRGRCDRA